MNKISKELWNLSQLIFGTALSAIAMGMIIIPMSFTAAGVTGFAVALSSFFPVAIPTTVLIVNMLCLLLGFVRIGKEFLVKTIVSSLLFPVMLEFFSKYQITSIESDPIICILLAGILLGTGEALVIRGNGSSGGFEILALIINKKYEIAVGSVINVIDSFVILLQIINKTPLQTIYGILTITISAATINWVISLGKGEAQITIISRQNQSIRIALLEDVDVGLTSYMTETGLYQEKQTAIMTVVPYKKVQKIKSVVTTIDPNAFVIISKIKNVLGKGYTLER